METVTITVARFEQLLRAEHDANQLKSLIAEKYENYESFTRDDLKTLVTMYGIKKEDN